MHAHTGLRRLVYCRKPIYQGHCVQVPSDTDRTHAWLPAHSTTKGAAPARSQPRWVAAGEPHSNTGFGGGIRDALGFGSYGPQRTDSHTIPRHRIPIHPYPNVVIVGSSCDARRVPYITSDSTCAFDASHPLRQRTTSRIDSYGILTYVWSNFRQIPPFISRKIGPATSFCNSSPTVKISPTRPRFCWLQQ